MPCKYGEFEYPESAGFSGSAGKSHVKGYVRGGPVKRKGGSKLTGKGGLGQARSIIDTDALPMQMQPLLPRS